MDTGIAARHARGCRHRESRCTCSPTFKAQVWDAQVGKRITKTFPTITAARRWRQDAYAALRSGTLTADAGSTLAEAADNWLDAARAGIVRNRSGLPYKPAAIRGYEQNLRRRVLPALGRERLREITLPQLQRFVDRLASDGARGRHDHLSRHAAAGDLPPRPSVGRRSAEANLRPIRPGG
jgi:hypothetical protein